MKFPKFTIFKDTADEFRFNLFAVNGRNILRSSEGYTTKQGCINGINSAKTNASLDARYKRAISKSNQHYLTLHARNGATLGISEMYDSKSARDNGIEAIKKYAPDASVEDLTLEGNQGNEMDKGNQDDSYEAIVVRDPRTFAGKPIVKFDGSSFDINTAVKVLTRSYDAEESIIVRLDKLANLPGADKIDTLVIGAWEETYDNSADFILDKLIELKGKFKSVKHLFVGDMTYEESEISWIIQGNYTNFWKHYPDLETFGLRGGNDLTLGKITLPKLKHMVIETGGLNGSIIDDINKSDLPNLQYLELWLGTDEYGSTVKISQLKPIFDGNFPNLKYLGPKNFYMADEVAIALKGAPVLERIHTLDISMGTMTDVGAKALFENDALLKLEHINCRHHFVSNEWVEKLQKKFAKQNINLTDQRNAEDDYYYVEIGE